MSKNKDGFISLSVSKNSNKDIVLRAADEYSKKYLEKIYNVCIINNNNIVSVDLSYAFNGPKSQKQLRFYKAILPKLVECISDIEKGYLVEEIEYEVKYEFCKYKLLEGIDLFRKAKRKDKDGNIIEVEEPIPFDRRVGYALFNEYIDFFKRYIESKFGIDPFVDL